ncbi:MAG: hypothetical protein KGR16_03360 [Verrucomicrobia bacterium]|nr:hypothetical protein [Verrucomicrobiota bacterium]
MKKNWWLLALCTLTACAHLHFSKEKKSALQSLQIRLAQMENEKAQVLQIKEDLQLRIASQNDPAWIEMVLIRELGVVPEGFLKVHFKK